MFYHKNTAIALVYAVLLTVWSSTWIMIKVGLHGAPPLIGAGARFLVAGVVLAAFQLLTGRPLRVEPARRRFVAVTALTMFGLPYAFVYSGETQVTAGLAAVLWSALPLYAALLGSRLLADEPLTRLELLGIGVGLCGLVVVFRGGLGVRHGTLGILALVGLVVAPASGALGRVLLRRDRATLDGAQLLAWAMGLAGVALVAVGVAVGPRRLTLDGRTLGSIAYMSLVGSVASFVLLHWLLGRVRTASAALIDLTLPLLTLLAAWAFYGERPPASVVLGSILVVIGLSLSMADAFRRARP